MLRVVIAFVFCINSIELFAQLENDSQFNSWWANINSYQLSDKVNLVSEVHIRRNNFVSDWQQFIIRPSVHWRVKNDITLAFGYSYAQNYPYGSQPIRVQTLENNFWEQIVLSHKSASMLFKHQFRMEHRFIGNTFAPYAEHPNYYNKGSEFSNRMRYRFIMNFPLFKKEETVMWYANLYTELLINMSSSFVSTGLGQHWLFASIGLILSEDLKIELGYRNQRIFKSDNIHVENNHTLDFVLRFNFDFRKRE